MDFTSIHNYYEHLVATYLKTEIVPNHPGQSNDFFMDIACYALTKLPTRYIRHDVDMAFYMDEKERANMNAEVKAATDEALAYIKENFNKDNRYDANS
jgi:hypothetical protein